MIQEIWSKVWRYILRYHFPSFSPVASLLLWVFYLGVAVSTCSSSAQFHDDLYFFSDSPSLFLYLLELAVPQHLVLCILIKRYLKRHKLRVHLLIVLFNSLAVKIKCKAYTGLIQNTFTPRTLSHLHVQYSLYLSNKYKGFYKGLVFSRFKVKLSHNGQGAKTLR